MAAGDPLVLEITLAVLDRDGSTRGFVACDTVSWTFGNGVDTPDLSANVSTTETDLAGDPDLFDDALAVLMLDSGTGAVSVGSPFMVKADDLTLVGGDDQAVSQQVTVSAKSALMILAEWQVTPAEGVWLRRSPQVIYFGWTHPDFDDSSWPAATRRDVTDPDVGPGTPKYNQPSHWENATADWLNDESGATGGLSLFRPATAYTPTVDQQTRLSTTADEEHRNHLYGPGYGGIVAESSKQETGYKDRNDFDRVLSGSQDYYPTFEMTTVNSVGGDGFDALRYYMAPVGTDDFITDYAYSSGNAVKVWRQDKDDPRPGLTPGKILLLVQAWNQAWQTPTTASCHTVTFSFTATEDSNGDPWTDIPEMSWRTGTPVTQLLADMSDRVDWDCHLDATDGHIVVDGWNRKGSDLSSAVPLVTGNPALDGNIITYRASRVPRTATRASILTEDGYTTKVNTSLESTVTPRATYLEAQQSASVGEGKALATRVITEDGQRQTYQATLTAVEGAVPGVDFDWGDQVSAPNRAGAPSVRTVLKHGGSRSGEDQPTFTVEMS